MDAEVTPTPEGAIEPRTAEPSEVDKAPGRSPEPLTVGNGSQVIAITVNLNIPILGPVVYASQRAVPAAIGGRFFDVVRRVVGGPRMEPEAAAEPEVEPMEGSPAGTNEPIQTDRSG